MLWGNSLCVGQSFHFYWRIDLENLDRTQWRCGWRKRHNFWLLVWVRTFPHSPFLREKDGQKYRCGPTGFAMKKNQTQQINKKTPNIFASLLYYHLIEHVFRAWRAFLLFKGVLKWWSISKSSSLFFTRNFPLIINEFVELAGFPSALTLSFTSP